MQQSLNHRLNQKKNPNGAKIPNKIKPIGLNKIRIPKLRYFKIKAQRILLIFGLVVAYWAPYWNLFEIIN